MRFAVLVVFALSLAACNPTPPEPEPGPGVAHPGEDTAGVGMRLQLVPTAPEAGSVARAAAFVAAQENPPGTYLCVCPPPVPGDTSQTRACTCQVEGAPEIPDVCGDGVLNPNTENCDTGDAKWCPPGFHCNRGGETVDGTPYPACFNCIRD